MSLPVTVTGLCRSFSIELTPREAHRIEHLTDHLPPGTAVYVTRLPNAPFSDTVEAVRRIAAEGMRPIPHLSARALRDERELDEDLAALTGEGGVHEILLIGGSIPRPVGDFDATIGVLRTGCLERRGIRRVGLAAHPEGSPDISEEGIRQALKDKNEFAAETAMDLYLVTQFCFAAAPVVAWERQVREDGNALPIHVGLPGLASAATLVRFGLSCGVGPSITVLHKQMRRIVKMASSPTYQPGETVVGIARAAADDPASLFGGFHFFPFGAFARTAAWARAVAEGRFRLDPCSDRLEVQP